MRPPPTTAECIEAMAWREPRRLALREGNGVLTYGDFADAVARCALHMQALGVRPGDRIAVGVPGFGLQLALLFAAEGLGALTASLQPEGDPDAAALLQHVDRLFTSAPQEVPPRVQLHQIDGAFVRGLPAPGAQRPHWRPMALTQPQRLARTSGSTGASKLMLLSRDAQEYWVRVAQEAQGSGPSSRLWMLGAPVMNSAFARCSAVLRAGGALLVGPAAAVLAWEPTHVWGLPLHLERMLQELPAGARPAAPVHVASSGGPVSAGLRQALERRLGGTVSSRYGCNEAGVICDVLDAEAAGVLAPGVELRILDLQGRELPAGAWGVIAVRTPSMAEGYLDRSQDTAAAFRDGWYLTGDVGALVGWRRLQLVGRRDDLVNLGGLKLPASQLEAQLRALPAVAEAAVLALHRAGGGATLGAAVVLAPGAREAEARAQVASGLRLPATSAVQLRVLPALPALANGKLDRLALLRLFQADGGAHG